MGSSFLAADLIVIPESGLTLTDLNKITSMQANVSRVKTVIKKHIYES